MVEERTSAVISTGHISHHTAEWLHQQGEVAADYHRDLEMPEINIASDIYGWSIYCDENPSEVWPPDLVRIMRFIRSKGYEYVVFDRDADYVEGLPVFDW